MDSRIFGGAESSVAGLLRELPAELPRALAARRPVPVPLAAAAADGGTPLVGWSLTPAGLARLFSRMRSAGVIHLNLTWPGANGQAAVLAWFARRPVVATLHLAVPARSGWRRAVLRLVFRRFTRVIAVSREIAAALAGDLHVPADRIRVVPNGVDVERRPAALGTPGGHRIGSLGRLTEQKGHDVLIAAAAALASRHPDLEVVVAGDGPEHGTLVARAEAAGAPVRFAGTVDDAGAFLAGLDIFCLPSRREGLPFALLEAMAAGLPCVASAVGEMPACLGESGITVAPDDPDALAGALDCLLSSEELRRRLGAAARQRVADRYSRQAFLDGTAAVLREVRAE